MGGRTRIWCTADPVEKLLLLLLLLTMVWGFVCGWCLLYVTLSCRRRAAAVPEHRRVRLRLFCLARPPFRASTTAHAYVRLVRSFLATTVGLSNLAKVAQASTIRVPLRTCSGSAAQLCLYSCLFFFVSLHCARNSSACLLCEQEQSSGLFTLGVVSYCLGVALVCERLNLSHEVRP